MKKITKREPQSDFVCDGDDGRVYQVQAFRTYQQIDLDSRPQEIPGDFNFEFNGRRIKRLDDDTFVFDKLEAPVLTKRQ